VYETCSSRIDALLRQVLRTLVAVVQADLGGFFVFDEQLTAVELGVIEGEPPPALLPPVGVRRLPPSAVPAERWLARHRRPLHLNQPRHWQRFPPANPGLRALADRGALVGLVLPLLWENELVGAAYLWRHRSPRPYSRQEIRTAQRWCQLATLVAYASRLYQREAMLRTDLEEILIIDQKLDQLADLDEVAQTLVNWIERRAGTCSGLLWLNADTGAAYASAFGSAPSHVNAFLSERLASLPTKTEKATATILSREDAHDLLGTELTFLPASVRELLIATYREDEQPLVRLLAWNDEERLPADLSRHLPALRLLMMHVGAALTRLATRRQLERSVDELRALLQLSRQVVVADSIYELLGELERLFRHFLRYDALIFLEPDDSAPNLLRISWGSGPIPEARIGHRIPIDRSLAGHAFRTGRLLHVPDTWEDPRTYHLLERPFPWRTLLLVPLRHDGSTKAVLGIGRTAVAPFSPLEVELVSILAQELMTGLTFIHQREVILQNVELQRFLTDVGDLLLQNPDPRSFARPLLTWIAQTLGGSAALVLRLPPDESPMSASSEHDGEGPAIDLTPLHDPAFFDWLARSSAQGTLELTDARIVPAPCQPSLAALLASSARLTLVSLVAQDVPLGCLLLSRPAMTVTHPLETVLLRELQTRLAHALGRWVASREQDAIASLARQLSLSSDPGTFGQLLLQRLPSLLPSDFATILFLDDDQHAFVPLAASPHFALLPADWSIPRQHSWLGSLADHDEVIIVPDSSEVPLLDYPLRVAAASQTASLAFAPLVARGQTRGMLVLGRFGTRRFTVAEQQRLRNLARVIALALGDVLAAEHERKLYRASVEAMAAAVDAKDPSTYHHSRRVATIARIVAQELGLPRPEIEEIELAALLHDIGKIAIPDAILRKAGKLDAAEWSIVSMHPSVGAQILAGHPQLLRIASLVRGHHERWDGQGYPDGLRGDAIPLGAAIIGLADAFDTMTTDRPYRPALSPAEALAEVRRCRGTQFHPAVVDAFLRAWHRPDGIAVALAAHTFSAPSALATQALHTIGEHVERLTTIERLAEVIDLALSGVLTSDNIALFATEEDGEALRIVYSRFDRDRAQLVRIPRGQGLAWRAIESGRALSVVVPEAPPGSVVIWGSRKLFAVLAAPIVDNLGTIGAIAVSRTERRRFSETDAELLASIGRHVGPLFRVIWSAQTRTATLSSEQASNVDQTDGDEERDQERLVNQVEQEAVPTEPPKASDQESIAPFR
jgi:putative nucleotidyltransferase with HDIG domain